MTIFLYDNVNHELRLNEPEILLIKEFAELWTNDRNISKEELSYLASNDVSLKIGLTVDFYK